MYADDIQLYVSSTPKEINSAASRLTAAVETIKDWLSSLKLVLNESKTELILLGSKTSVTGINLMSLKLGSVLVDVKHTVRSLGVHTDRVLSM